MDDKYEDQQACKRITRTLQTQLRKEFPYMKLGALGALINRCSSELKNGVAELQPAMNATRDRVSFMSLSAELRNEIYWLAMKPDPDDEEDQEIYDWQQGDHVLVLQSLYCDKYGYDPDCPSKWWYQPSLARVSRQVREESLGVFYGNIEFHAYGPDSPEQMQAALTRLGDLGKEARLIKDLYVVFERTEGRESSNLKEQTIEEFGLPPGVVKVQVLRKVKVVDDGYEPMREQYVDL